MTFAVIVPTVQSTMNDYDYQMRKKKQQKKKNRKKFILKGLSRQ